MGKHYFEGHSGRLEFGTLYAIMAAKVTSHNTEHLAICARIVDKNRYTRGVLDICVSRENNRRDDCGEHFDFFE